MAVGGANAVVGAPASTGQTQAANSGSASASDWQSLILKMTINSATNAISNNESLSDRLANALKEQRENDAGSI